MARPNSRETLKQYCLRELGKDVIQINVSDEQLEDRIDEALQLYFDYHYDATIQVPVIHQITQEDKDTKKIILPSNIISVSSIYPLSTSAGRNQFSYEYQYELSAYMTLRDIGNDGLTYYTQTLQRLSEIQQLLNPLKLIDFNRHSNELRIVSDWTQIQVDDYILLECYVAQDPSVVTGIWNDYWLKKYVTQLFKKQWGSNLSKFDNVQLLGGVTYNGQKLYEEAVTALEKLEEDLREIYSEPVQAIFIG